MVLVQKWPFFHFFFLGNIVKENVFYDVSERKNAFLGYKNKKFKKSKNWHFSHGFNPKMTIFPTFLIQVIYSGKMGCFLVLRKLLLVSFCVVVWVLFSVFSIFCITSLVSATPRNPRKMSFTIFQNEKTPIKAIKTRNLKSRKIDIFAKVLTLNFGPKMANFKTF